jgi:low temperature requirement protein LtrA
MPQAASVAQHLRPRTGEPQETTPVELFFDLVYVLAITQLSHLLITTQLSWVSMGHVVFLLLVVWWAWIYTTWMVNWLDPGSTPVRMVIILVGLASLLMAAALPEAFTRHGFLFAAAYVSLQVGRNLGGALLLRREHPLGETFRRLLIWSLVAGVLWLAGARLSATWASKALPARDTKPAPSAVTSTVTERPSRITFTVNLQARDQGPSASP